MNHIHPVRRLASILVGLTAVLSALTVASPVAFAMRVPQLGPPVTPAPAPVQIHTIVTGGMLGWQIALIAAGAAVLAATAAVLVDRTRAARRHTAVPTA